MRENIEDIIHFAEVHRISVAGVNCNAENHIILPKMVKSIMRNLISNSIQHEQLQGIYLSLALHCFPNKVPGHVHIILLKPYSVLIVLEKKLIDTGWYQPEEIFKSPQVFLKRRMRNVQTYFK